MYLYACGQRDWDGRPGQGGSARYQAFVAKILRFSFTPVSMLRVSSLIPVMGGHEGERKTGSLGRLQSQAVHICERVFWAYY